MKEPDKSAASTERSMEFEKRFRAQTLAIAISTPILTALLSWIVIAYQLSSEHSFTSQQKLEERRQRLLDEKVRLTGEAARLSGEMLGIRRQIVFDEFRLDLAQISTEHSLDHAPGDFDRALNVVREDWIRLSSIDAQVQSVFKIPSLHFSSKVQKAIEELGVIKPSFKRSHASSIEEASSRFDAQLKTEDEYWNSVYQVIDAMASEAAPESTTTSK